VTAADFNERKGDSPRTLRVAADGAPARIVFTCRTAAAGRSAVRAIAEWSHQFGLSEPEFQVLWCLRSAVSEGLDQTTLARQLVYSAAQVSATVERMREQGWIIQRPIAADRRRHLWQLSDGGRNLLGQMLDAAGVLRCDARSDFEPPFRDYHERGDAA
jgi:DNA-binding MarR family transcriptional regulator